VHGDRFSGNVRERGLSMKLPPAHKHNNGKVKENGETPEQQTQRRKESYMGMGKEMKQERSCQGMV
jgi:hypothetical protein